MAPKKKNTKPAKANKVKVVKATTPSPPPTPPTKTSSSFPATVFMAFAAFLGGVLTPPSLHAFREVSSSTISTPSSVNSPPTTTPLSSPLPTHVPCTPSNLADYLHASPVPGLHVVCVEPIRTIIDGETGNKSSFDDDDDDDDVASRMETADSLRLTFYKGSHAAPLRRRVTVGGNNRNGNTGGVASIAWGEAKAQLIQELRLPYMGTTKQPWAAFTALGTRIVGEDDDVPFESNEGQDDGGVAGSNGRVMRTMAASGLIVVVEGGNWVWPGVREGFRREIRIADDDDEERKNVTIETLSLRPLVVSVEGFLSEDECDYIADKARPSMRYSSVSLKDADKGRAASDWRTSQSTFLSAADDPILTEIEHRTAGLARVPRNHQEYVQVLRYGAGEKYDSHHDYFDPKAYASDASTLALIERGRKNRFATVFWYLTDVREGGETIFPRAGGRPPVRDHADCSKGLKVTPRKGKAIVFYSQDARGELDPLSLHGACPVLGEDDVKWAANKWLWNAPMRYVK